MAARYRAAHRTPLTLAHAPSTPATGSAYSVQRSPSAVRNRPGVFPAASSHECECTCGAPILRLARLWSVRFPSPVPLPRGGERSTLLGFGPLRHVPARRIRITRDFHLPAPSALRVWSPSRRLALLRAWRRPVDRHSAHGVRPSGPCSSRPAVPLSGPRLSCRFPAHAEAWAAATPEVDSDREGERGPPPKGGCRRTLPSWVFAPPGRSPPPP
jgi:hypothetical protein